LSKLNIYICFKYHTFFFWFSLMALFQLHRLYSVECKGKVIMNGCQARIWKDVDVAYLKLLSQNLAGVSLFIQQGITSRITSIYCLFLHEDFDATSAFPLSPLYGF